jgi:glycerate-2-kinase
VIGGGETTVSLHSVAGKGGPNQEFALSAALFIENIDNLVIVGLDSDGTDGPTEFAGAMTDDSTLMRSRKSGINLFDSLKGHNVTPALSTLGDAILTGAIGTNVNDLNLMIISPKH